MDEANGTFRGNRINIDGVGVPYQTPECPPTPGGLKFDQGKVQAGVLLDFRLALMEVAKVGTFGAEKYERDSWRGFGIEAERREG